MFVLPRLVLPCAQQHSLRVMQLPADSITCAKAADGRGWYLACACPSSVGRVPQSCRGTWGGCLRVMQVHGQRTAASDLDAAARGEAKLVKRLAAS
jgi:hypothetical protein